MEPGGRLAIKCVVLCNLDPQASTVGLKQIPAPQIYLEVRLNEKSALGFSDPRYRDPGASCVNRCASAYFLAPSKLHAKDKLSLSPPPQRAHQTGLRAMSFQELKKRLRSDYGFSLEYRTRWSDNDMYDHMNNSVYSFLYDSIVNAYLMQHCSLHPPSSGQIGLVVHSSSDFFGSVGFPAVVQLGLKVSKLGKSSVTYEIGVFEQGVDEVKAVGSFTHVFVDRESNRPAAEGMSDATRKGLEKLLGKEVEPPKL
ncbi:MAG: hypothetical protein M4579_002491 [Chaenotheca gracillima]|nr:MAG: hypothetical protein M4579_002491 [Chaenotheca gracillima]